MPRNPSRARPAKHLRHAEAMRRDIANLAARLMAEDGVSSYSLAKRKAAKQLGAPDSEALPANPEIEAALHTYLALYQGDELHERLTLLRREALELMRLLAVFNPYLTGPVLDGTAGRYAEAEIELFADSAKDVEIFLLERNFCFEPADIRHAELPHGAHRPEARLRLEGKTATVQLAIYPYILERMRRRNPHTGQVPGRAGVDTVAALLESP
ncbi:MAG: hypothetical protein HY066_17560 [Betaproteobacteria bacterium]|nr:hypothetical protein [Betaproteobacteria bacterium]